ncbi:MAG: cysteine-rich CWC family protein [Bacteroidetes bacterium]|nr:cysteine-rich CWC family protein [Bacteroidota bacterium]
MTKKDKTKLDVEICPRCGKQFHCSKSQKCWCYEMDVPVETLEKLQYDFESCICPECLKLYSR